jgi:hypothetical protein
MSMKSSQRFVIPIAVAMVVLVGSSAQALTIELHLPGAVRVGDTLALEVHATGVFDELDVLDEVLAFGFDVLISDGSLISFQGATIAAPFDDDSGLFPNTDVAGSAFPALPNDGNHNTLRLATLLFRALDVGALSLGIVSNTSDLNEGIVYVLVGNKDVTASTPLIIVPRSSAPEPQAFALLITGVLSLLRYKRHERRRVANS